MFRLFFLALFFLFAFIYAPNTKSSFLFLFVFVFNWNIFFLSRSDRSTISFRCASLERIDIEGKILSHRSRIHRLSLDLLVKMFFFFRCCFESVESDERNIYVTDSGCLMDIFLTCCFLREIKSVATFECGSMENSRESQRELWKIISVMEFSQSLFLWFRANELGGNKLFSLSRKTRYPSVWRFNFSISLPSKNIYKQIPF